MFYRKLAIQYTCIASIGLIVSFLACLHLSKNALARIARKDPFSCILARSCEILCGMLQESYRATRFLQDSCNIPQDIARSCNISCKSIFIWIVCIPVKIILHKICKSCKYFSCKILH